MRCGVDKEGGGRAVSDRGRSLRVGGEGKIREGGEDMKQGWMEGRKAEKKTAAHLYLCSPALMSSGWPPGASLETRRALQRWLTGFKRSIDEGALLFVHEGSTYCTLYCVCIQLWHHWFSLWRFVVSLNSRGQCKHSVGHLPVHFLVSVCMLDIPIKVWFIYAFILLSLTIQNYSKRALLRVKLPCFHSCFCV